MMNPGDMVRTHMWDASIGGGKRAFKVQISDLTTGQSGVMAASAANGFMNTSMFDCSGTPFNFQPLFNTARSQNSIGWSVLISGILNQFEIGHFVPCSKVTNKVTLQLGPGVTDTTWLNCHGPYEAAGPPDPTPGGQEPTDALCYKKGDTHGGLAPPNLVTGCLDNFTQNGDLDFDGTDYYPDFPNKLTSGPFPSPFLQQQPTTAGAGYSGIQFETDAPASEINTCVPQNPQGCAVPPPNGPGTSTRTTRWRRSAGSACGVRPHEQRQQVRWRPAVRPPGRARVLQGPARPRERGAAKPEEVLR
ncbi:MAG TPA: hypothetical protein VGI05_00145 [Streptosporangiaceae bacterium]|jgi:hypothetical protein